MANFNEIPIIFSENFLNHKTGPEHPDTPARLISCLQTLKNGPLKNHLILIGNDQIEQQPIDISDIIQVHSSNYLMALEEACLLGKEYFQHPDNNISYDTYQTAILAARSCAHAIDIVETSKGLLKPFCLVRPPGHHAGKDYALGFCFINNVAVATRFWQNRYDRRRIFILDIDAHHGNGLQDIFLKDSSVFYASIHEDPAFSFPGTGLAEENGLGPGKGFTLNCPISCGSGDRDVLKLLNGTIKKAMLDFNPDAIICACGFDGHVEDDLSSLSYSTKLFGHIGAFLSALADKLCSGRLLSILEGGYNLKYLGKSLEMYLGGTAI